MELTGLTAVPANFASSPGQGAEAPLSLDATKGRPLRLGKCRLPLSIFLYVLLVKSKANFRLQRAS